MYSKVEIKGTIKVETGMHIGGTAGFSAIGAVDSSVVKDAVSKMPYIPGSTIKGKMRSLLAKAYNEGIVDKRDDDHVRITRLFGASRSKKDGYPKPSRLIFADSVMSNSDELKRLGAQAETEIKTENNINPITAVAMPRQIERVIPGAEFPVSIIYNVMDQDEMYEDMETLATGMKLLQYDYIGGHGSRGYGRISIRDLQMDCVIGEVPEQLMTDCRKLIEENSDEV